jgi:hypothetical protein
MTHTDNVHTTRSVDWSKPTGSIHPTIVARTSRAARRRRASTDAGRRVKGIIANAGLVAQDRK